MSQEVVIRATPENMLPPDSVASFPSPFLFAQFTFGARRDDDLARRQTLRMELLTDGGWVELRTLDQRP